MCEAQSQLRLETFATQVLVPDPLSFELNELNKSLAKYTTAKVLSEVGVRTTLFTRISTVAGGAGSVDTPRDVRGFAVKFYTKEGNWDLVGNNIPVFFIQDAIKFPDFIHAVKMEPDSGFPQSASAHDNFWDFISLTPESMHAVMWAMSGGQRERRKGAHPPGEFRRPLHPGAPFPP